MDKRFLTIAANGVLVIGLALCGAALLVVRKAECLTQPLELLIRALEKARLCKLRDSLLRGLRITRTERFERGPESWGLANILWMAA